MTDLDEISRKILRELQANSRLTNLELAARVGLSPSACLRRVQELERRGTIQGYTARVDPSHVGRDYLVYVAVALSDHSKAAQSRFEQAMTAAEEVTECHNIAGVFEYLLRVEARDLAAYKRFHSDVLGTVPGVRSITSHIVMGTSKDAR